MHELSIARHLLSLISRYTPAGEAVSRVCVDAGPLRTIDPDALQWAWQASIPDTNCQAAALELHLLPWPWRCPTCGHQWDSQDYLTQCRCGCDKAVLRGGDELNLTSLDIDETTPVTNNNLGRTHKAHTKQAVP
jgi:Zn finger protein HypA/HybF involved in hydrogenase expression